MTDEDGAHDTSDIEPDVPPRDVPNYDGREVAPRTAGERLLWIPRILVAPLYFVTEFVLRRPLSGMSRLAEQSSSDPLRFFVFGRKQNAAIAPTFYVDFGDQPSVGLYFRWNEAGHANHRMRFYFATWGKDWLRGRIATRLVSDNERWELQIELEAYRRADGRHFGLGSAVVDRGARYQQRYLRAVLEFEAHPWRHSYVHTYFEMRERRFSDDVFTGQTIPEAVAQGLVEEPPGYADGYWVWAQGFEIRVDSRDPERGGRSGGLVRIAGEHAFDIRQPETNRWLHWSASLGGYLDVSGAGHVLALHATAKAAETLSGEIPFTELPTLGGEDAFRGFRYGHLRGESAANLILEYSWPIWAYLDGLAHLAVGNVYDGRFDDFSLENLRMSFGIGIGAIDAIDHRFELVFAWGTDTFERGPSVISYRIAAGGRIDF